MKNVYTAQGTGSSSQFIIYFKIWNSDTRVQIFPKSPSFLVNKQGNGVRLATYFIGPEVMMSTECASDRKIVHICSAGNMKAGPRPLRGKMDEIYWRRWFLLLLLFLFVIVVIVIGYPFSCLLWIWGERLTDSRVGCKCFQIKCSKTNNIIRNYRHFSHFLPFQFFFFFFTKIWSK